MKYERMVAEFEFTDGINSEPVKRAFWSRIFVKGDARDESAARRQLVRLIKKSGFPGNLKRHYRKEEAAP